VATHAAFLRGINLGKSRRVKNEDLRVAFEEAGFEDVATFRASGNVILGAEKGLGDAEVAARAEAALATSLGFEVVAFVRTVEEVATIATREPFEEEVVAASAGKLQVAMLPDAPGRPAQAEALSLATDDDRLAIHGGVSDSELDLKALEALLGPWTMRTMGTIEAISAKVE
jgi:uncharacterized protein (DUF1697 family)